MSKIGNIPACESPRFRDFVCSFGCAFEPFAQDSPCNGEIEPHHFPGVAQGGTDYDVLGLCHKHHSEFHAHKTGVTLFVTSHAETLRRKYVSAWLNLIEEANGVAPAPQRQQRKSTRKNRVPFEPYVRPW